MGMLEDMKALCDANAFMNHNHIRLHSVERDRVVMELTAVADSLNPYRFVHGGALYTMADCACGTAARTDGRRYVTLSSSLSFLHSGLEGDHILADAKVRRRGRSTCYVDVDVTNEKGDLLASGNYNFFCIG